LTDTPSPQAVAAVDQAVAEALAADDVQPMRRARPSRGVWLAIALAGLSLIFSVVGVILLSVVLSDTGGISDVTSAEERALTEHRQRNELSHDALCDYVRATLRTFGVNPDTLTDDEGKPVECPEPLTEAELNALRAHPPAED
jgi:hypothetical protein